MSHPITTRETRPSDRRSNAPFHPGSKSKWRVAIVAVWGGLFCASLAGAGADLPRSARPDGAEVYFITPRDGETVSSPVVVRFGLAKMGVAPAGIEKKGTGHHHLIVDAALPPMDLPIPSDEHHRHFGGGQTEVVLDLPPGRHTLQLVLADHLHIPHDPPIVSERITITVKE